MDSFISIICNTFQVNEVNSSLGTNGYYTAGVNGKYVYNYNRFRFIKIFFRVFNA